MFLTIGFIFIILSLAALFFNLTTIPGIRGKSSDFYDNPEDGLFYGSIKLLIGITFIIYGVRRNKRLCISDFTSYSKCPKCKEAYENTNLNKGIRPKCNVETIDIDEYYEKKIKNKRK